MKFAIKSAVLKQKTMFWGGVIFNFIGASVRWLYGTIWRTIRNKKKYKFHEYLRGPDSSEDFFDNFGHQFVNRIVGFIVLMSILAAIVNLS